MIPLLGLASFASIVKELLMLQVGLQKSKLAIEITRSFPFKVMFPGPHGAAQAVVPPSVPLSKQPLVFTPLQASTFHSIVQYPAAFVNV